MVISGWVHDCMECQVLQYYDMVCVIENYISAMITSSVIVGDLQELVSVAMGVIAPNLEDLSYSWSLSNGAVYYSCNFFTNPCKLCQT